MVGGGPPFIFIFRLTFAPNPQAAYLTFSQLFLLGKETAATLILTIHAFIFLEED